MARGIATQALAGGDSVKLLGTETAKAQAMADELSGDVRAGHVGDPPTGDVVVLAVWSGEPLDVLVASGDDDAKAVVSRIVTAAGLRPIDAGPLKRARELAALGYLHMVVQEPLGTGYGSTVKLLA